SRPMTADASGGVPEPEQVIARIERAECPRAIERCPRRPRLAAAQPPARDLVVVPREPRAHASCAETLERFGRQPVENAGDLLAAREGVTGHVPAVPPVAKDGPI